MTSDRVQPADLTGKRVRLRPDVGYGQRIADYLTDEQVDDGPEGVVVRQISEDGDLFLEVDLENVPFDCRFPAEDCELL